MRVPLSRLSRVRGTVLAIIAAMVLAFPLGVLAAHQFGDVPNGHTFHNDIDALVDAGITAGCGGGNYCPNQAVTRGQMAAFMNRLGALGPGKVPVVNADKLDGLDSSAFYQAGTIVTSVDGSGWLAHEISPTTVDRFLTNVFVSTDTGAVMVMPLTAPTRVGGVTHGLTSVQICMAGPAGGGFIDTTVIGRTAASGAVTQVFADTTNRTTTGCYSVSPNVAVGEGLGLAVVLGGGGGGSLSLGSVETTWSSSGTFTETSLSGGEVTGGVLGE